MLPERVSGGKPDSTKETRSYVSHLQHKKREEFWYNGLLIVKNGGGLRGETANIMRQDRPAIHVTALDPTLTEEQTRSI